MANWWEQYWRPILKETRIASLVGAFLHLEVVFFAAWIFVSFFSLFLDNLFFKHISTVTWNFPLKFWLCQQNFLGNIWHFKIWTWMHLCMSFFLYPSKQRIDVFRGFFICFVCCFVQFFIMVSEIDWLITSSSVTCDFFCKRCLVWKLHSTHLIKLTTSFVAFLSRIKLLSKIQISFSYVWKIIFRGNVLSKISFSFWIFSKGLALLAKVSLLYGSCLVVAALWN